MYLQLSSPRKCLDNAEARCNSGVPLTPPWRWTKMACRLLNPARISGSATSIPWVKTRFASHGIVRALTPGKLIWSEPRNKARGTRKYAIRRPFFNILNHVTWDPSGFRLSPIHPTEWTVTRRDFGIIDRTVKFTQQRPRRVGRITGTGLPGRFSSWFARVLRLFLEAFTGANRGNKRRFRFLSG